jgi:hypothetical protein
MSVPLEKTLAKQGGGVTGGVEAACDLCSATKIWARDVLFEIAGGE